MASLARAAPIASTLARTIPELAMRYWNSAAGMRSSFTGCWPVHTMECDIGSEASTLSSPKQSWGP